MKESAVCFGENKSLVGILTEPKYTQQPGDLPAILFLSVGGLHRVGPNRVYVGMARRISELGFVTLRFDLSGMGDSRSRSDHLPFKQAAPADVRDAMEYLSSTLGLRRFVLVGHCAAADLSLEIASTGLPVVGAVLINGFYYQERETSSAIYASFLARNLAKHLFNIRSWQRVLTRKHDLLKLLSAVRHRLGRAAESDVLAHCESEPTSIWQALFHRGTELLLLYSEGSSAYDRFKLVLEKQLGAYRESGRLQVVLAERTDHLFTPIAQQGYLINLVSQWISDDTRDWRT